MVHYIFFLLYVLSTHPGFTQSIHNNEDECTARPCIAIVDAGSSASRLHVYAFDTNMKNEPSNIKEVKLTYLAPGLSSVNPNSKSLSTYLRHLMQWGGSKNNIPVYFYATAGMRLLPKAQQNELYVLVKHWFSTQKNWRLIEARTIDGQEEGVFAWLAVDYYVSASATTQSTLVGILDIGGASMQIAFPMKAARHLDSVKQPLVNKLGQDYRLLSYSFLGLGQNEIKKKYGEIASCYPIDYPLPKNRKGTGDVTQCVQILRERINSTYKINQIIFPALSASPVNTWYLLGGISNMVKDKLFSITQNAYVSANFLSVLDLKVCKKNWADLRATYADDSMVSQYCFLGSYLYALIVGSYGISMNEPIHFLPATVNADWTIGVILQRPQSSR
jgi:hypothetical protein